MMRAEKMALLGLKGRILVLRWRYLPENGKMCHIPLGS
jgi:hypothetical protein